MQYSKEELLSYKDVPESQENILDINLKTYKQKVNRRWRPKRENVDVKKVKMILNKITDKNYDKMVKQLKEIEYKDPEIVKFIFAKAVKEPFFSAMYAKLCGDLEDLVSLIDDVCFEEFDNNRDKNLAQFIGHLYRLGLIKGIEDYTDILMEKLEPNDIEALCNLITTAGPDKEEFKNIKKKLNEIKHNYGARYKFMIMDLLGE